MTALALDGYGLRQRIAHLRPQATWRLRAASAKSIGWLARCVELAVIALGWLLVPVLPLVAAAVARDGSYARNYPTTLARVTRHIRATWQGRAISRMLVRKFEPAGSHPPQRIVGTCSHCGNCCLNRSCVFVQFDGAGRSSCRIYGGRVWRLLTCGDYPIDGHEIDLYRCPSFTALPDPAPGSRRVIPLVPAGGPPRGGAA